ncbi:MAG: hypothetical protein WB952_11710 [Terriglobales bacterium]
MEYSIYAALTEEDNEGWVWIQRPDLPTRTLVKVRNPTSGRTIFCAARHIDDNFLKKYNGREGTIKIDDASKALVISEWYRDALGGIETSHHASGVSLIVTEAKFRFWRNVRAACHHPDFVARVGTRLGILGVWLGLVAFVPPILDLGPFHRCSKLAFLAATAGLFAFVAWLAGRRTGTG